MPVVEWRQAARADLLAIVDHISDDNPDAAQRLKDDLEARVARLPDHPELYRAGRVPGTREMVVRSNYVVVYAADARRDDPARAARRTAMAARPGLTVVLPGTARLTAAPASRSVRP